MKEHKKRMIANQKKKKQAEINHILFKIKEDISKVPNACSSETNKVASDTKMSSLYSPIPFLDHLLQRETPSKSDAKDTDSPVSKFWSDIPAICTPDKAKLDSNIASEKLLKGEATRQKKYLRKLEVKMEAGEITEEEKSELIKNYGRKNMKEVKSEKEVDSFSLLNSSRGLRKRQQVENIASLFEMFGQRKVVVDFGSGSGNLCLALASYYRNTIFVFADQNVKSLEILSNRAKEGGLTNVRVMKFSFTLDNLQDFIKELQEDLGDGSSFDLGIGLHCCGRFTDLVMEACKIATADCIVVPCCNGKMDKNYADLAQDHRIYNNYPRSAFLSSLVSVEEYFQLSRAADDLNNYEAKCAVEFDRAKWAEENGFAVSLLRMEPSTASPKHHVLYCSFTNK